MVAVKPVDFGKGADGLAALVRDEIRSYPFDGAIYVFWAKRADRVKLIWWDGMGVCLYAKQFEDGKFQWPAPGGGVADENGGHRRNAGMVGVARTNPTEELPDDPHDDEPAGAHGEEPRRRCPA